MVPSTSIRCKVDRPKCVGKIQCTGVRGVFALRCGYATPFRFLHFDICISIRQTRPVWMVVRAYETTPVVRLVVRIRPEHLSTLRKYWHIKFTSPLWLTSADASGDFTSAEFHAQLLAPRRGVGRGRKGRVSTGAAALSEGGGGGTYPWRIRRCRRLVAYRVAVWAKEASSPSRLLPRTNRRRMPPRLARWLYRRRRRRWWWWLSVDSPSV